MIPKPPPREGSLGFIYHPPYRVQGVSTAGEATCVQIPELDLCFDMGLCPRAALASKFVAVSHGHMDHVGGLAYYCSQRRFQGMGDGTIVCSTAIAGAIEKMMEGYVDLERQRTPYNLVALPPEGEHEIKNNIVLRAFDVEHTAPTSGYAVVEKRSKLRPEYVGLPQEKLRELKDRGIEITHVLQIPLIAYLGDTLPGAHLVREDVRRAKIIITECTFFEPDHVARAKIGMHLHVNDVVEWLRVVESELLIIVHLSRRTNMHYARQRIEELAGEELASRVAFLMDHRTNRANYEKLARQVEEAANQGA
ncbi:MAG: MBL fold metallo-hydrolase, partial [Phycisphaerales bacterium]